MIRVTHLITVTAVVSGLASLPVSPLAAVMAAPAGALAAAVIGAPVAAWVDRRQWHAAWQAVVAGVGASSAAASILACLIARPSMAGQFVLIAAPFGAASAVTFWATDVRRFTERRTVLIAGAAVLLAAIAFGANHEIR